MVDNTRGGRTADPNGYQLMLADSQTAANNYGLKGGRLSNAPKAKNLFYVKFHRPSGTGWEKGVGVFAKSVDRPRISFQTETLNQYNRKRVVQKSHEFETIQFRFYDTMSEQVGKMFVEYYQFYYTNSTQERGSTSVYDVVRGEMYKPGEWGFRPPLEDGATGYFFSHITVYQLFNGQMSSFELVNPKIRDFNPDEFDVTNFGSGDIQLTFDYENIIYLEAEEIPGDLITEMGLDRAMYWNVPNDVPETLSPGSAQDPNRITSSIGEVVGDVLARNIFSAVTGQGFNSVEGIIGEVSGAYDANRGIAIGKTAAKSLKNIVSGNKAEAKQGVQGLLKGVLFGKPGKLF